ncbi:transglutaminase domain-containing protein [Rufibacter roseus]|uniref:Transglutaminase domain-containing protein n=1 Tax=Rufibacter roseus TaxID=1567108 RepID=A0ABW2DM12_9BACT|nr:transglutaminase domain-containing protein [Rufibacter roseus]
MTLHYQVIPNRNPFGLLYKETVMLPIVVLLVLVLLCPGQLTAASEDYSFKKAEKLFSRGKYEKVLDQIRLLERNRFSKEGRLKYSLYKEVRYYHYKLSSRILLKKIGSLKESVGLYKRLFLLDSTKQFVNQPQYQDFKQLIIKTLESTVDKNNLAASRLFVDVLALQGDTVAAYRKVYPVKEALYLANKEALHEFIKNYDYSEIDRKALMVKKQSSIENQAFALTKDFKYDFEKVRAIYIWIVQNISYDYSYKIYDAQTTFKANKGVCSGFSYLFKEMCLKAGIKAYRIEGYAEGRPAGNHAWNSVEIEGYPFLIESTWASCIKEKTNYYYLISEKELSRTHKPEEVY